MISASHNPYHDNGIKFFSGDGFKLPDDTEHHIEAALDGLLPSVPDAAPSARARRARPRPLRAATYLAGVPLGGVRTWPESTWSWTAPTARPRSSRPSSSGAWVPGWTAFACDPDGRNINAGCGSLHADVLARRVRESGAAFGFAFDGDADRCLAVTFGGRSWTATYILYRDAQRRARRGRLFGDGGSWERS